ncbi:hypothetical protein SJI19_16600 [Acerihabitans sp. TG2]|uniref:hypothetical protein n=1 Tax=Acerihabitans sp. TG2 TaxID=3096008 RepID=UPI002B23BDE0|nr:hypothetical protein [Acerihabitans sp. TG2]MEA9392145.1 hypothetical protein [Acerihabitans sp. TG2]
MYNVELNIEKPVQSLSGFIRELRKVNEELGSKTDAGVRLSPKIIQIDPGYNTRFEGYSSPEEYFAVPLNRQYLEKLKAAYRGDPDTTLPPPIQIEIIDSVPYNRDGNSRLFAIKELYDEGFEVKLLDVNEVKCESGVQRDLLLLRAQDGSKFSSLAIGALLCRLLNSGWSRQALAQERGITVNSVNNFIESYRLPQQIKRWIADGIISQTLALEQVRKYGIAPTTQKIEEAMNRRFAEVQKEEEARRQKEIEKQKRLEGNDQAEAGDRTEVQGDIPGTNAPLVLDGGKNENTSDRALLRPSDLKPKSLPKKIAESFHNSLLDLVSLDDEERYWRDEASKTVVVTLQADEFDKLLKMRQDSVNFDNENFKRLGGTIDETVSDVDELDSADTHNAEAEQSTSNTEVSQSVA